MKPFIPISFLFFFFPGLTSFGQEHRILYDWPANQKFKYQEWFPTLNDKIDDEGQVQIVYPEFIELPDEMIRFKVNRRMREILYQTETDSFKTKLMTKLMQILPTHLSIKYIEKDPIGVYGGDDFKLQPTVNSVEYMLLSSFDYVVTFVGIIEYSVALPRDQSLNDYFFDVYYFDLKTGKEYRPSDVFKPSSLKDVKITIEQLAGEQFADFGISYIDGVNVDQEFFSYTEEEPQDSVAEVKRELVDFSVTQHGFLFPTGFALRFYIPKWTPSAKNFGGTDLKVRINYDEIKKHFNPNGPFGRLINFSLQNSTELKNQNTPYVYQPYPNDPPLFPRLLGGWEAQFVPGKIKTISISTVETVTKKSGDIEDVMRLWKQMDYFRDGYLAEIRLYSSYEFPKTEPIGRTRYIYDQRKNLIIQSSYDYQSNDSSVLKFVYDKNDNLLSSPLSKEVYYYANNMSIRDDFYAGDDVLKIGLGNSYSVNYFNANGLLAATLTSSPFTETSYYYDSNKNLILTCNGYPTCPEPLDGGVMTYDSSGRLLMMEYDDHRYTTEYVYDDKNNLTHKIENTGSIRVLKTEYDKSNRPIKASIENKANPSVQTYYISYELWED